MIDAGLTTNALKINLQIDLQFMQKKPLNIQQKIPKLQNLTLPSGEALVVKQKKHAGSIHVFHFDIEYTTHCHLLRHHYTRFCLSFFIGRSKSGFCFLSLQHLTQSLDVAIIIGLLGRLQILQIVQYNFGNARKDTMCTKNIVRCNNHR